MVTAVRAGNTYVYERLFRTYYAPLCEFAFQYVHDDDVAEEVVQHVLVSLWMRRETWQVRSTVRAYLYGATRNRALSWRKKSKRYALHLRRVWQFAAADLPADRDARHLENRVDAVRLFEAAVARLSERRQTMLLLRVSMGLSYREIAETLGTTVKNVETTLARIIRQLEREVPAFLTERSGP